MQKEAKQFWDAIAGKVRETVRGMTRKTLQAERYDVTTAPNSATGKIGVTLPFGGEEIMIPYSAECALAQVGDTVLVVWWNSMSTAKAWFMGNGPTQIRKNGAFGKAPEYQNSLQVPEGWNLWFGSHNFFGGYATGVQIIHYGGDSGAQFRIYGSDNTAYSISFLVNAIQLHTSTDGGNTWTLRWTK